MRAVYPSVWACPYCGKEYRTTSGGYIQAHFKCPDRRGQWGKHSFLITGIDGPRAPLLCSILKVKT